MPTELLRMKVHYATEQELNDEARKLVDFDVQSLLQMVAAERKCEPELWLAEPAGYEKDGHRLRDSASTRLIAYSIENRIVYGTDGCNACRHVLDSPLETCAPADLVSASEYTQLPLRMLERMAQLVRDRN